LLTDSSLVRTDPWILSAEIATAAAIGKTSRNTRVARNLLNNQNHSPFHLSELASALGTLEAQSGNLKSSRPLIDFSMQQPAENAIAQAAWLYRNVGVLGVEKDMTCSSEANAWYAWRKQKWSSAHNEAKRWQIDQPFSSRPVALAAHLACVLLEDDKQGAELASYGLMSNPRDFTLMNVLALALARQGNITQASHVYSQVDETMLTEKDRVVWLATKGLIAFRQGNVEIGRRLYERAIALGNRLHDIREPIARIYHAFEEIRAGTEASETIRKEALDSAQSLTDPSHLVLVNRLRNFKSK
jgi:hypothetical protein